VVLTGSVLANGGVANSEDFNLNKNGGGGAGGGILIHGDVVIFSSSGRLSAAGGTGGTGEGDSGGGGGGRVHVAAESGIYTEGKLESRVDVSGGLHVYAGRPGVLTHSGAITVVLLDPADFTPSLGASPFTNVGTYFIDTSKTDTHANPTLIDTDGQTVLADGVFFSPNDPAVPGDEIAVFTFDNIDIGAGVSVVGMTNANSRPVALLSYGDITIDGSVIVSGADGSVSGNGGAAGPGGGGGGGGGSNGQPGGAGGFGFVNGANGSEGSRTFGGTGGLGGNVEPGGAGGPREADGGGGAFGGNGSGGGGRKGLRRLDTEARSRQRRRRG
jgi:hypothetical protein